MDTSILEYLFKFVREEFIILVPVLLMIGWAIKNKTKCDNAEIPWLLCVIGSVLSATYLVSVTEFTSWQLVVQLIFNGITQGCIAAALAVLVYQIYIQQKNKNS